MSDTVAEFRVALRSAAEALGCGRPDGVRAELNELVTAVALSLGDVDPFVAAFASRAAINRYRECYLFDGGSACRACTEDAALGLLIVSCSMAGVPALRLLERIGVLVGRPEGAVTEVARRLGVVEAVAS
jgi:hypothetical protein